MKFVLPLVAALACLSCAKPDDGRIVLRVATWSGAGEGNDFDKLLDQIYRDFEKENPGIKLVIENMPGDYVPKVMLSHIANVVPDVTVLDASSSALFVKNGVLEDLTPYLEKDPSFPKSQFYDNTLQAGAYQGKQYSIPVDFTPMVMYYNKDLFDQAHVPYPHNGWSFEEFQDTCAALANGGKKAFVLSTWMPGWVMWLWNHGGAALDAAGTRATGTLDSPQNAETIEYLKSLVYNGYAPKLSEVAATGVDPFENGDVAMAVNGHWALVTYKSSKKIDWKRLGIVSMPTQLASPTTVYYASGLGIGAGCKHPDAAWKFIKHFTSYKNQLRYNATGIAICARKDVAQERAKEPIERDFLGLIAGARPPTGTQVEGYAFVEQQGQKMMDSVLNGRKTPAEALHEMAVRIDREFAK